MITVTTETVTNVGMKVYIQQIDLRTKLSRANCSTEEAWTILKASIEEAVSKFVPKKVRRKTSNKPLWWNKEIYRARPLHNCFVFRHDNEYLQANC